VRERHVNQREIPLAAQRRTRWIFSGKYTPEKENQRKIGTDSERSTDGRRTHLNLRPLYPCSLATRTYRMQGIEEQRRPRRRRRMKRIGAPLPGHPCLNNHGPKRDLAKGVANAELTLSVGCAPNFAESSSGARLPTSTHRCHSRLLYRRASQLFLFLDISHNEKPVHCTSQHNFIKISENRRPSLSYKTPGIWHRRPRK
jgi:hypothetical protein